MKSSEKQSVKFPTAWYDDFKIDKKGLYVKQTDTYIPIRLGLLKDVASGIPFFLFTKSKQIQNIFSNKKPIMVFFTPTVPRPWYLVWTSLALEGIKITRDIEKADAVFYFEDKTYIENPIRLRTNPSVKHININCIDISKTRVAKTNKVVFGYELAVNPETYTGTYVRKSEQNAAHDGTIFRTQSKKLEGYSYQKLINNIEGDQVVDLRCITVGGEIPVVIIKKRPIEKRFENSNSEVTFELPEKIFSSIEIAQIKEFCIEMDLDWGSLDALRDHETNEIYIVDANKTDMGPPVIMKLEDKITVTNLIAKAFRRYLEDS